MEATAGLQPMGNTRPTRSTIRFNGYLLLMPWPRAKAGYDVEREKPRAPALSFGLPFPGACGLGFRGIVSVPIARCWRYRKSLRHCVGDFLLEEA